ncbi:chorismate mutase [Streptomyces pimonensis]|uniref:chorismate mutase n=1 Tax=Streptomyces pimonensis TaxID=2860288 RepID=A0ABV4J8R6_9ACTN
MAVRAVRGAVQSERGEAGHMEERVGAPLTAVPERNGLHTDDLTGLRFTATPDPHGDFPAAVRKLGTVDGPPTRAQEPDVDGARPRVVRVPARTGSGKPRAEVAYVRPGAAAAPRRDVAQ